MTLKMNITCNPTNIKPQYFMHLKLGMMSMLNEYINFKPDNYRIISIININIYKWNISKIFNLNLKIFALNVNYIEKLIFYISLIFYTIT